MAMKADEADKGGSLEADKKGVSGANTSKKGDGKKVCQKSHKKSQKKRTKNSQKKPL